MLYKFYSAENGQSTANLLRVILEQNTLRASDPRTFNDPFECKVVLDLEASDEIRRMRYFHDNPASSELDYDSWNRGLAQSQWWVEQTVRSGILADFGIASFTQDWAYELFWAHYARHHTGFCIGYDPEVLAAWPEAEYRGEVQYVNRAPIFKFFHHTQHDFVRKVAFHKSAPWVYEREYRLVFSGHGIKVLPEGAIKEVIVGCRAGREVRDLVCNYEKPSFDFEVFQAAEDLSDFSIDRYHVKKNVWGMTSHF